MTCNNQSQEKATAVEKVTTMEVEDKRQQQRGRDRQDGVAEERDDNGEREAMVKSSSSARPSSASCHCHDGDDQCLLCMSPLPSTSNSPLQRGERG